MKYFIRDFDTDGFHARASKMQEIAGSLNEKYGAGTVEIEIVESYYNMREKIEPCRCCADPRGNRRCKIKF